MHFDICETVTDNSYLGDSGTLLDVVTEKFVEMIAEAMENLDKKYLYLI
jgi:hypothetical protein